MKKISVLVFIAMILTMVQSVKAESYKEWRERDPEGFYAHFTCTDEESIANGCYTEYGKESSVTVDIAGSQNNGGVNRGYVFGDDELHIIGTPSDSSGYTAAGDYTNQSSKGKGWVYDADELHVIGLPSDPETGYTLPGFYGNINE